MIRFLKMSIIVGLVGLIGCGSNGGTRDTTVVDVTANVTGPDGKPLSKTHIVLLQPTGDTLGGRLEATVDGTFTGKAAPGRYVYFVKMAKSDTPPKGIATKYTEPSADNTVDVSAGKTLEIKLSN